MISYFLIIAICLVSAFINNKETSAFMFFSITSALSIFADILLTDSYFVFYYIIASMLDFLVIAFISRKDKISESDIKLQLICVLFIFANAVGWLLYESYSPPTFYNYICAGLYLIVLITLIKKGRRNGVYHDSNFSNNSFIYLFNNKRVELLQSIKEKTGVEKSL